MSGSPFSAQSSLHPSDRMQVDTRLVRGTGCSGAPTPVAYSAQDLTPYSAVSSFNYPATADATLLTPVSGAGSPSMQQQAGKAMRNSYNPATSSAQQPTPPASTGMFYNRYDVNASSQSSSPMTVNPQSAEDHFDLAYMDPSPKENGPGPVPYFGHYGVSEPSNEPEYHGQPSYHHAYVPNVNVDPNAFLMRSPNTPMSPGPHMPGRTGLIHGPAGPAPASILAEPHPGHYRSAQGSTLENIRGETSLQPLASAQNHGRPTNGSRPKSTRPKPRPSRKNGRSSKTAGDLSGQGSGDMQPPPLELDDKATEEEKHLFELRRKFVDEKGKGMWDAMKNGYEKRFGCKKEKAALQMKISRAVCKHAIWPEQEKEMLRQAFYYEENRRYERIIARMRELGGARVWDWKPQHIEAQLVKMGLEEPTMDETTKLRRRRHAQRKRAAAQQQQRNDTIVTWPRPISMTHPSYAFPTQMAPSQMPYEVVTDATMGLSDEPEYPTEQEEEVLDQLDRKYAIKEESQSPSFNPTPPDGMDISYSRSDLSQLPAAGDQQSERVARQACEQLMAHQRIQNRQFTPSS